MTITYIPDKEKLDGLIVSLMADPSDSYEDIILWIETTIAEHYPSQETINRLLVESLIRDYIEKLVVDPLWNYGNIHRSVTNTSMFDLVNEIKAILEKG